MKHLKLNILKRFGIRFGNKHRRIANIWTKVLRQGWKLCKMWCHASVRMTTRPYPHLAEDSEDQYDHFYVRKLAVLDLQTAISHNWFLGCLGSLESWNSRRKGLSVTLLLGSILLVNSNWKINMLEDKVFISFSQSLVNDFTSFVGGHLYWRYWPISVPLDASLHTGGGVDSGICHKVGRGKFQDLEMRQFRWHLQWDVPETSHDLAGCSRIGIATHLPFTNYGRRIS